MNEETENSTTLTKEQKAALRLRVKDISNIMEIIDLKRGEIIDAVDETAQDFNISKRNLRKIVKAYHKSTFKKELTEMREFEEMYDEIFNSD